MNTSHSPYLKSYQDCIISVLSFYDVQVDIDGLVASIPKGEEYLRPTDLSSLGEKIGFTVKPLKIPFDKIPAFTIPLILEMDNGEACVYYPDQDGKGRFYLPGKSDQEISVSEISDGYQGEVYVFMPKDKGSNIDISHMDHGHALDWFWNPMISFWGRYAEVIFCSVFINILALAIPLFTLNVYDRVIVNFVPDTLIVLTSGVIVAIIFDFFFKTMRSYIIEHVAARVSSEYDVKLMERLIHIKDVDIHLSVGEKSNLFRELNGIKDFYASRLVPTLVDVPFFIFFTIVIYIIAPALAIIPVVAAAIVFILNYAAQFVVGRATAKYFTSMQNKSSFLVEMLGGLSTIRILSAVGSRLFRWRQASESSAQAASYNALVTSTVSNMSVMVTQIMHVCIVFFGVYQIDEGSLTIGGLIACTIIYGRAIAPVVGMASVLSRLKQTQDVLKAIDKIFQLPHDDSASARKKNSKGPFKGNIELKDITYQYPMQTRPALYKLNLQIKAGDHIGLIGKTGAGKSTLSSLIAGLIKTREGNVYLDSYTYTSITDTELYRSIGYVPQDAYFFQGSIRDNIVMGDETIKDENLERAMQMSGLDLVVQQTGEGLDMDVGEAGKRLSGGQRQAIALARAFVRDPDILVFDEPTNGMDSALEERVKASLKEFIQGKTFIMVTHRTTLLPLVGRLVLLDQGRIMADGNRDEIVKKLSNGA
ncbi:MAG: ATP-binding cassette domain-containing protein [Alphaproteobacteria bacterium]